jgi:predicted nucleic acid-binding protein
MIVVADSGPLHYLILLEQVELLQRFYGQVVVPEPVANELSVARAPAVVREWITKPPTWIDVRPVAQADVSTITDVLDFGERAAIALAETTQADLLLIDEAAGRAEAKRRHLRVTGTLGVLRSGAEQGLVNVPDLLERLKATSFYLDGAPERRLRTVVVDAPILQGREEQVTGWCARSGRRRRERPAARWRGGGARLGVAVYFSPRSLPISSAAVPRGRRMSGQFWNGSPLSAGA